MSIFKGKKTNFFHLQKLSNFYPKFYLKFCPKSHLKFYLKFTPKLHLIPSKILSPILVQIAQKNFIYEFVQNAQNFLYINVVLKVAKILLIFSLKSNLNCFKN